MVNLTTNGKVIIINGKSTIPVGTFRVFKNETLRTVTMYGINGYDLEITLVEGFVTVNNDMYPLQMLFDFIVEYSAYSGAPTINIGDGEQLDISQFATKAEVASKADKSALNDLVSNNTLNQKLITKADKNELSYYPTRFEMENQLNTKLNNETLEAYPSRVEMMSVLSSKLDTSEINKLLETKANITDIPDVSDYVKTDFVISEINKLVIPEYDLSIYETKAEANAKIANKANISDLPNMSLYVDKVYLNDQLSQLDIPLYDLTPYVKTSTFNQQMVTKANKSEIPNITNLASFDYVDSKIEEIEIPNIDLSPYVTNSVLTSTVSTLATKNDLLSVSNRIPNVTSFVDANYVNTAISNIPSVDLSNYVLSEEVDELLSLKANSDALIGVAYKTDLIEFLTEGDLTGLATQTQLALKANKSEIPSVVGLATEDFVTEQINKINIPELPSLTPYETIANNNIKLNTKLDKTTIPNPENLATKSFVLAEITNAQLNTDLEINLDGYATIDYVDSNINNFITIDDLNTKFNEIVIPDLNGYATELFVTDKISKLPVVDLEPYVKTIDLTNLLLNKADVDEIPDVTDFITNNMLTTKLNLKPNFSDIPSISGLIKTTEVNTLLSAYDKTSVIDQKLLLKADISQLPNLSEYIKQVDVQNMFDTIPENYLTPYETTSEVNEKLILKANKTDIPSLEGYAKITDVHSYVDGHQNIASKTYVESYINDLNLPDFDLFETKSDAISKYATKADTVYVDSKLTSYTKTTELNSKLVIEREISDDKYFAKPVNPTAALYNTSGLISFTPKIWIGTVTSSTDGMFTVTFEGVDFSNPPMVVATANTKGDGTEVGNANWVSIYQNSITNTGFKGRTKSANTAGLLAAMVSTNESNVDVNIIAIGY